MCVPCEAAKSRKNAALALRLKAEGMAMDRAIPLPSTIDAQLLALLAKLRK